MQSIFSPAARRHPLGESRKCSLPRRWLEKVLNDLNVDGKRWWWAAILRMQANADTLPSGTTTRIANSD
jgi:hypothetical protein